MNSFTTEVLTSISMNNTCLSSLLWTQTVIDGKRPLFYICIVAVISHSLFWFQIVFCSSLRHKSLYWIYAYMTTDAILLFRFLFSYIIHTASTECQTNLSWVLFICYFEAASDNYLNIIEPYILLALNICRHIQIACNRNVYEAHPKLLIIAHIGIYSIPLIVFISEFLFGWTRIDGLSSNNCDVFSTNVFVQVFNILVGFALPISLNILVIFASLHQIHIKSSLKRTQHYSTARDKYQRSLIIQVLCFYLIWLALWSPYVIAEQLSASSPNVLNTATIISLIGIVLDPIIIAALDVHFLKAWQVAWGRIKAHVHFNELHRRRVQPATIHLHTIPPKNLP